jgi:antirestriction protein
MAAICIQDTVSLKSRWIHVGSSVEDLESHIKDLLGRDPAANDWVIVDAEGMGDRLTPDTHYLVETAAFVREHGEVGRQILNHCRGDLDAAQESMREGYLGEHESLGAWARAYMTESGHLKSLPEWARDYFDFTAWARDAACDGKLFTIRTGPTVHVFLNV